MNKAAASPGARHSVVEALRAVLSSDRYPLHSRLPAERQLCELLNVSRSALRTGLDSLERDGRIWRHVGKGTFVGGRPQSVQSCAEALGSDTTLSELLEARMLVEPQVARLAALRAEASDVALLERYDRAAARSADWVTWDHWDELFHRAVAEAGGNGLMISAIDQILRVKKRTPWTITRAKTFDPMLRDRYSAEHRVVIDAIAAHDAKAAGDAMELHMRGISSSIGPVTARTGQRAR